MRLRRWTLALLAVWLAGSQVGLGDVGNRADKAVPDVNKLRRNPMTGDPDPNGVWVHPADMSCWLASAANLLGGAGYGSGANAQARAESIYRQMMGHYGWRRPGFAEMAINWWLYNHGKNSSDPNSFAPTQAYTDVTVVDRTLTQADYNFLRNELARCQYVSVKWQSPAHYTTLVGGTDAKSRWRDSDRGSDAAATTEEYTNGFAGGQWNLTDYAATRANQYVTLCPGLNKPENAMREYDVAWYLDDRGTDPNRIVPRGRSREAGYLASLYDDPNWVDVRTFHLDNVEIPEKHKLVYLLVDFTDRDPNRSPLDPNSSDRIRIRSADDPNTLRAPTWVQQSADKGQALYFWNLPRQPAWEELVFADRKFHDLFMDENYAVLNNVKDWNVATYCIPEPATLALALVTCVFIARRR